MCLHRLREGEKPENGGEGFDDSGVEGRGDIKDESLASSSREGGWVKACGEQGLHARVLRVLPFLGRFPTSATVASVTQRAAGLRERSIAAGFQPL